MPALGSGELLWRKAAATVWIASPGSAARLGCSAVISTVSTVYRFQNTNAANHKLITRISLVRLNAKHSATNPVAMPFDKISPVTGPQRISNRMNALASMFPRLNPIIVDNTSSTCRYRNAATHPRSSLLIFTRLWLRLARGSGLRFLFEFERSVSTPLTVRNRTCHQIKDLSFLAAGPTRAISKG